MSDADLKTLKLAVPAVSDESLEAFIRYQKALVAHAHDGGEGPWEGRMAFAHAKALKESGADAAMVTALAPVVADFCGRRSTLRELLARREEAARRGSAKDREVVAKVDAERARLEDLSALNERYGAEAVGRLAAREAALVELHRQVADAFGRGHLHRL